MPVLATALGALGAACSSIPGGPTTVALGRQVPGLRGGPDTGPASGKRSALRRMLESEPLDPPEVTAFADIVAIVHDHVARRIDLPLLRWPRSLAQTHAAPRQRPAHALFPDLHRIRHDFRPHFKML